MLDLSTRAESSITIAEARRTLAGTPIEGITTRVRTPVGILMETPTRLEIQLETREQDL